MSFHLLGKWKVFIMTDEAANPLRDDRKSGIRRHYAVK